MYSWNDWVPTRAFPVVSLLMSLEEVEGFWSRGAVVLPTEGVPFQTAKRAAARAT